MRICDKNLFLIKKNRFAKAHPELKVEFVKDGFDTYYNYICYEKDKDIHVVCLSTLKAVNRTLMTGSQKGGIIPEKYSLYNSNEKRQISINMNHICLYSLNKSCKEIREGVKNEK